MFEQQLADTSLRLRNEHLDRQIAEITQQAAQPGTSDEKKLELLQTRQGLRESKRWALTPKVADDPVPEADFQSDEYEPQPFAKYGEKGGVLQVGTAEMERGKLATTGGRRPGGKRRRAKAIIVHHPFIQQHKQARYQALFHHFSVAKNALPCYNTLL